ncbi:MAG: DNA polymerase Y family protein [Alphaproteobacteria bacterium]
MLIATVKNAQTVTALNDAAAAAGLSPGMTLSHARALVPDVETAPADPRGDRAALEKLADWCCRYSPSCGVDDSAKDCAVDCTNGDFGLWIDSAGCAHLFGGEEAMLADLDRRLTHFGLRHRLGLADTLGGAWGLARFHPATSIVDDHEAREALCELPVAGLRLSAETLTLLRRLGLKTVGQLAALPRTALARRFTSREESQAVLRRLDQLFGMIEEPLTPRRPPPVYRAEQAFLDPLTEPEALTQGLALLTSDLCRLLTRANQGAVRLAFLAFRVDGEVRTLRVGTSLPTRDPSHIARLFAEKLEKIDPGFGIEKLALHAKHTAEIEKRQNRLKGGVTDITDPDERLAQLIDHLTARLGEDAVTITTPIETHLPEGQAAPGLTCKEPAMGQGARTPTFKSWGDMPLLEGRPSCLLLRPEPIKALAEVPDGPPRRFTWRRVTHRIVKAEGPERIAPTWVGTVGTVGTADGVDLASETRDYYRVEDEEGRRYWLFRQGLYDTSGYTGPATEKNATAAGRTDGVCWFIHGVFG